MFLGTFEVKFSGKGRLVLPKKIRDELGRDRGLILSRGLEGCIWGWKKNDWEKESNKYLELPITDRKLRDIRRYLFSGAEEVSWDVQGRIIIPSALLSHAHLTSSKVIVIGAGDHLEIWQPGVWKKIYRGLKI